MANKRFSPLPDSGSNLSSALGISEHTIVRMMAGEADVLRSRLADALEQVGYRVLDENPLRAKHGARGAAEYYSSANALDYPTTLGIGLKQQGTGSTRVTFDYAVVHGYFGKGDRQSLTREAEAIIALAAHRALQANCIICGADFVADSRFCRKCGAPATATEVPAELEVMRLTANGRAGHQWTSIGATVLALGAFLPMVVWLLADFASFSKGEKVIAAIAIASAIFGWWALLAGIRRTHLTLNPRDANEEEIPSVPRRQTFSAPRTNELALEPPRAQLSITEGTTNLLNEVSRPEREPVLTYRTEEKPAD